MSWTYPAGARDALAATDARDLCMGDDAVGEAVNADRRSHEVPGLYSVDKSVFPSARACRSALTIMALSRRGADRFLERNR